MSLGKITLTMIYGLKCIFIRSGLSDFLLLLMVIFFYIPAIPVLWGGFGQGTGPIFLQDVACHGTESFLLSCSRPEIGSTNYCSHFDDVGVVCQGKVMYWVGWGEVSPYL